MASHEPIRCFLVEPVPRRRQWLLRKRPRGPLCRTGRTHRALVPIEDGDFPLRPPPRPAVPEWKALTDDPRWPTTCDACSYAFDEADERQLFYRRIYRLPDGGACTLADAPLGAMWDAWWLGPEFRGRDGWHLAVLTPGGPWHVDGRSPETRLHWRRYGTPPEVSVVPSIFIPGRYHGWLRDGILTEV